MGQYLVLLYDDEKAYAGLDEAGLGKVMEGHNAFSEKWGDAVLGGNALETVSTATTVRADGAGGFTTTDGPFVESKEALGGYYLVEAADLDAAIAMAKDIPILDGGIEVRPIMVFS